MVHECVTCKHYSVGKCSALNVNVDHDFICGHYRTKRSGAFRRKMAKLKRKADDRKAGDMAEVEVVIRLPKLIKWLVDLGTNSEIITNVLWCATRNGALLPKGHGRLIDADRVISEATERMKYPTNYKYMECVIAHMKLAPAVIDAESEE